MLLITKCENYENCWSLEEEAESKESWNNPLLETCLHSEGNQHHDDYDDHGDNDHDDHVDNWSPS